MIRYLLAVALLVAASCVPVLAGEPVMKADPAYGVRYAQEQVVTLPQDQETPYLTLFGDRNDPKFRAMVKWFETNETLAGIKSQTHFNVIYSDQPMYGDRYASYSASVAVCAIASGRRGSARGGILRRECADDCRRYGEGIEFNGKFG